ncbi:hypothetical protein [Paracoccus sediminis]|nr:hypothetical protein [Paracoccus sediminis]
MRVLATIMMMVSLLAMSVAVAGADIAEPPCSPQIRADDMCYAAGLAGGAAESVKKPGVCLVCLAPPAGSGNPVHHGRRVHAAFGAAILSESRWTVPWRPPRI